MSLRKLNGVEASACDNGSGTSVDDLHSETYGEHLYIFFALWLSSNSTKY